MCLANRSFDSVEPCIQQNDLTSGFLTASSSEASAARIGRRARERSPGPTGSPSQFSNPSRRCLKPAVASDLQTLLAQILVLDIRTNAFYGPQETAADER